MKKTDEQKLLDAYRKTYFKDGPGSASFKRAKAALERAGVPMIRRNAALWSGPSGGPRKRQRDLDIRTRARLYRIYQKTLRESPVDDLAPWLVLADAFEDIGEQRLAEDLRRFAYRINRLSVASEFHRWRPYKKIRPQFQEIGSKFLAAKEQWPRLQRRLERVIHE